MHTITADLLAVEYTLSASGHAQVWRVACSVNAATKSLRKQCALRDALAVLAADRGAFGLSLHKSVQHDNNSTTLAVRCVHWRNKARFLSAGNAKLCDSELLAFM